MIGDLACDACVLLIVSVAMASLVFAGGFI